MYIVQRSKRKQKYTEEHVLFFKSCERELALKYAFQLAYFFIKFDLCVRYMIIMCRQSAMLIEVPTLGVCMYLWCVYWYMFSFLIYYFTYLKYNPGLFMLQYHTYPVHHNSCFSLYYRIQKQVYYVWWLTSHIWQCKCNLYITVFFKVILLCVQACHL